MYQLPLFVWGEFGLMKVVLTANDTINWATIVMTTLEKDFISFVHNFPRLPCTVYSGHTLP